MLLKPRALSRRTPRRPPDPIDSGVPGRGLIVLASTQLPPSSISLAQGATLDLDALWWDSSSDNPMPGLTTNWQSAQPGVCTVNASGVVTGVAAGVASITASVNSAGGQVIIALSVDVTVTAAAVASVVATPPSVSLTVGGANGSVTADTRDGSGNSVTGRTLSASSSDTGVATVAQAGYVTTITPVGAGSFTLRITDVASGIYVDVPGTVVAATGDSPNKPSGLTDLGTALFADWTTTYPASGALHENMRRTRSTPRPTYTVIDSTAPFAGQPVLEWKIPTGAAQGSGPEMIYNVTAAGREDITNTLSACKELYVRFYLLVPNGYRHSNGNGLQKLGHIWANVDNRPSGVGGSTIVPAFTGTPDAIVDINTPSTYPRLGIRFQGMSTAHGGVISFNLSPTVNLTPGRWYLTEWLLRMNTIGAANGEAYLFVDGALRQSATNLCYKNIASGSQRFTQLQWNNTYGGTVGTQALQDSTYRWAKYHAAGRN